MQQKEKKQRASHSTPGPGQIQQQQGKQRHIKKTNPTPKELTNPATKSTADLKNTQTNAAPRTTTQQI